MHPDDLSDTHPNAPSKAATAHVTDGCDCHVHVIGSPEDYPFSAERAYTSPPASVEQLQMHLDKEGLSRVVLIQPSFYGIDNRCMMDALKVLGNSARGVAVIDDNTPKAELNALHQGGVKGVRINLASFGEGNPDIIKKALEKIESRVTPFGWHIQLYASAHMLGQTAKMLASLNTQVVLDHFAMVKPGQQVSAEDQEAILSLIRSGKAYVKLSAPYRLSPPPSSHHIPDYHDLASAAKAFIKANPERIVWGSDWPHTDRDAGKGAMEISPFRQVDDLHNLALLKEWAGSEEQVHKILVENPARLYGFA
ncbi:2-pyrone-4,6-dicarbaxylate hydrolase [Halomonadaceae bacterium LMG 33818]|uniref:amidohydrolase family protein n=1 Tax=Cernens ardua TaxID=3402176 RepID=UPI003EDC700A